VSAALTKQADQVHRATFGNKGRSSEQASVANHRQKPDEFGPAAGMRDEDSPSNE
jgi:hypothetical protein